MAADASFLSKEAVEIAAEGITAIVNGRVGSDESDSDLRKFNIAMLVTGKRYFKH